MQLSLRSFFGLIAAAGILFSYAQIKMPNKAVGHQPILAYCVLVFVLGVGCTLTFTSMGLSLNKTRGGIVCAVLSGIMWILSLKLVSTFDNGVIVANLGIHVGQASLVVGLTIWLILSNPPIENSDTVLGNEQVERLRNSKKTAFEKDEKEID